MGRPTKIETPRSETNICTNTNHFERNRTQDRLQRAKIQESRRVYCVIPALLLTILYVNHNNYLYLLLRIKFIQ